MVGSRVARVVTVVAFVVAVLLCVPAVPSLVASLAGWHTVSDGAATAGHVSVTDCRRSPVGVTATCRGTFEYADPGGASGAQPSGYLTGVTIANDPRRHGVGDEVDASLVVGTNHAYVSSGTQEARVVAQLFGIGVILNLLVVALTPVGRPIRRPTAAGALVVGAAVFAATWLMLPTPPALPTGPEPSPVTVSSP